MPTKVKKVKKAKRPAVAFHVKDGAGKGHVVGIGNLRVVIIRDDNFWFAQGLEIDYAAQGTSVNDAKKQFEDWLAATIQEHLRVYGKIDNLLRVTPTDTWEKMLLDASSVYSRYSQISVHQVIRNTLPFQGIDYIERRSAT